MKENLSLSPLTRSWALVIPFFLWLLLHHGGAIGLNIDNYHYYYSINYYFHFLSHGILPMWDPYRSWGWPDAVDSQGYGFFNPLYLLIPLLKVFGITGITAFNIFCVSYYWIGLIGFYLLAACVTGSEAAGLLAYAIFMFSCIGELLFSQLLIPLTLFPGIWFFYFFLSFFKAQNLPSQKKHFCGAIFMLMIIAITYLPFFFLVFLGALFPALLLFSPKTFGGACVRCSAFLKKTNPVFVSIIISFLILACIPGLIWCHNSKAGNLVILNSRNNFSTSEGLANIPLSLIDQSGLSAQMTFTEIFSDLDLDQHYFSYVTIFLYIMLSLGFFTRMSSGLRVIFFTGFFVFIFSLTNVTPVHAFLYHHLFIFRLFRNIYFLGPFLIALLTTVGVAQYKVFLDSRPSGFGPRFRSTLFILAVHALWFIFLRSQDHVIWTSYATLAASALVLCLHTFGLFDHRRNWLLFSFLFVIALQPMQTITDYYALAGLGDLKPDHVHSSAFSYLRPLRGEDPETEQGFGLSSKKIRDESGFFHQGYYGSPFSYALYSHIPPQELEEYVHYKFMLYDHIEYMDDTRADWAQLGNSLSRMVNCAWVADRSALGSSQPEAADIPQHALALSGPSFELEVKNFTPNSITIKTDFPAKKFLVFNDSYYPGWRAFINGRQTPLYRTNAAFKGIWVDRGRQNIEFIYGSPFHYLFNWAMTFLFLIYGFYICILFIKGNADES